VRPRRLSLRVVGVAGATLAVPLAPVAVAAAPTPPTVLQLVGQKLVLAPDEPLVATFAVSGPLPDGAELAVTVSARLRPEREGLHKVLDDGDELGGTVDFLSLPVADIPRDAAGRLSVTMPTVRRTSADRRDTLRLNAPGLYPVTFEVRNDQSDPVSSVLSFVARTDDSASISPLSVALVTSIESPPAGQPDGIVVVSERARADLTRLAAALEHNTTIPATVSLPPELLERLAASGAPEDQQLMSQLTTALAGRQVLSRPYVTMDPSSSAHAGLAADYTRLLAQGEDTLRALFPGITPDRSMFLVRGGIDDAGLQLLRGLGALNVVLPSAPAAPEGRPSVTDPTRTVQVRGGEGAMVRAAVLDADLLHRLTMTQEPVLAAHYVATELIALQAEQPAEAGRGVVVLPPEGWAVDPVFLGTLEDLIGQIPQLRPVDLGSLFSLTTAATAEDGTSPVTVAAPASGYVDRSAAALSIAQRRLQVTQVSSMLPATDPMAGDLRQVLDLSLAEDLPDKSRDAYLATVDSRLAAVTGSIVPMDRRQFTITSRRTTIPITVRSTWTQPLRVKVRLTSPKLAFPKGDQIITVTQDSPPFRVPVEAKTNGTFQVTATLLTPEGDAPLGPPMAITVRSTALSGLGILVTVVAALGLAVWWVQHLRWKRRRRAAADAAQRHPTAPIDRDQLAI
jgi:hypothetical protein